MRSGSLSSTALTRNTCAPIFINPPGLRFNRSSSVCSATAPHIRTSHARASPNLRAGASATLPKNGYAPSTAFSSTSWRSSSRPFFNA